MKNKFLSLTLVLFSFNGLGQTSVNLNKFYFNLPIDSCSAYIKTKIIDTNFYKPWSLKNHEYKININLMLDNHNVDSITMRIVCLGLAIGGSPKKVSPIEYEQWLNNTFYFNSTSAANKFFKNQKTQLDSLATKPFLNEDAKKIEWIYSFAVNDIERVRYRQVHLIFEKNSRKVKNSYRLIFNNNPCKCD